MNRDELMRYSEFEHRYRFAAWCASRAASSSRKCRFSVRQGVEIANRVNLFQLARGWEELPHPSEFDQWHRKLRRQIICAAKQILGDRHFTHGVAAKFINVYMKALFAASAQERLSEENRAKLNVIHPPVDRLLINGLIAAEDENTCSDKLLWKKVNLSRTRNGYGGWSSLNSEEYEKIVHAIRRVTDGKGLWRIEKYWKGFQ